MGRKIRSGSCCGARLCACTRKTHGSSYFWINLYDGRILVITGRFADTLEPGFEAAKEEIGDLAHSEEDVLSYIAFPQQAKAFFEERAEREKRTFKYTIQEIKE